MKTSEQKIPSQVPGRTNWWLRLTSSGWDKPQDTIARRELTRRSRLTSWILLGSLVALLLFIPAMARDVPSAILVVVAFLFLLLVAVCNRMGQVLIAGSMLVALMCLATLGVVLMAPGGQITLVYLPAYDFMVVAVVVGASLLPRWAAFIIGAINIILIYADLILQPKAADLQQAIDLYGLAVLAGRPVALHVLVAVVAFLWVRGMDEAVRRADRAEDLRMLEHEMKQAEARRAEEIEVFVQSTIRALRFLANGQEGLVMLPPGHPLQEQATFLNAQLKQFYLLKQESKGPHRQVMLAAELLLRRLRAIGMQQMSVNALDPRHFSTHVTIIDELASAIYILLTERARI
ncbi:hypothetical protein EI42_01291 [Thermosporothrix hazakensis]|jgi:hypothetical protein|uniref:Uncharacterized protein n=2 Tax=Thermosporothrix TaxID=768650 RepID=A0A326UFI2_THEHA|nr:hypothetical protein [Thermosporothrix hazakensis]PZW34454.1 hypothetical protein EI42_01291 [Thermosporothrix hazakensis]BBH85577.1 hypothetical protein KTC_03280 [Thermosporothrix sp. COM3]GCE45996.1 hypothetical protein KTH_08650 [Thermosporothrix hazakensis]